MLGCAGGMLDRLMVLRLLLRLRLLRRLLLRLRHLLLVLRLRHLMLDGGRRTWIVRFRTVCSTDVVASMIADAAGCRKGGATGSAPAHDWAFWRLCAFELGDVLSEVRHLGTQRDTGKDTAMLT